MAQLGTAAAAARAPRLARLFAVLILGLLLVQATALPWRLAGIPLALAALWCGGLLLRALTGLRRQGRPAPGWLVVSVGMGLTAVLLVTLAFQAAAYPVLVDDEACRASAVTNQAQRRCTEETRRRLGGLGGLGGLGSPGNPGPGGPSGRVGPGHALPGGAPGAAR